MNSLNDMRSEIGAIQNKLESSGRSLLTQRTNTLNAASMFDTDYAKESLNFFKQNVMTQIKDFWASSINLYYSANGFKTNWLISLNKKGLINLDPFI